MRSAAPPQPLLYSTSDAHCHALLDVWSPKGRARATLHLGQHAQRLSKGFAVRALGSKCSAHTPGRTQGSQGPPWLARLSPLCREVKHHDFYIPAGNWGVPISHPLAAPCWQAPRMPLVSLRSLPVLDLIQMKDLPCVLILPMLASLEVPGRLSRAPPRVTKSPESGPACLQSQNTAPS